MKMGKLQLPVQRLIPLAGVFSATAQKKSTQRRGFFLPRRHATPQYGYLLPPRSHQRSAQFSLTQPQ